MFYIISLEIVGAYEDILIGDGIIFQHAIRNTQYAVSYL